MSSRLERQVASALAIYRREPPEARAAIENGLAQAAEVLSASDRLSDAAKLALQDTVETIVLEGFLGGGGVKGGGWTKVHKALAAAAPDIYEKVKGILPRAGNQPLPF